MTELMPAVFFGHGNPINALAQNDYTRGWATIGAEMPRPKAVFCVSAHWYVPGTFVTTSPAPRTIHTSAVLRESYMKCSIPRPVRCNSWGACTNYTPPSVKASCESPKA